MAKRDVFSGSNAAVVLLPSGSFTTIAVTSSPLIGNAFVGLKEVWPWLYYASFYLAISLATTYLQIRTVSAESDLASFARIARPFGPAPRTSLNRNVSA